MKLIVEPKIARFARLAGGRELQALGRNKQIRKS